jgi:hypothetical protein
MTLVKKRSEGIGQIDDYLSVAQQFAIPTGGVDPVGMQPTDESGGTTKVPLFFNTSSNELRAFYSGAWNAVSPDLSGYALTADMESYVATALGGYYDAAAINSMLALLNCGSFNLGVDPTGNLTALREQGGDAEQTAGALWIGWNLSNGLGEIDFLSTQGTSDVAVGGFQFWKINNEWQTGQEDKLLLNLKGDDYIAVFGGMVALGELDDYASPAALALTVDPTFNIIRGRSIYNFGQDLNLVLSGTFFQAAMGANSAVTIELPAVQANDVYQVFIQPVTGNSRGNIVQNQTQESFDVEWPDGEISGDTMFNWLIIPNNFFLP